jgi:hypothetical protein
MKTTQQSAKRPEPAQAQNGAIKRAKDLTARGRRIRPTAAIAIALAAGFLVWLLFIRGGADSGTKPAPTQAAAAGKSGELVSADNLINAVAGAGFPVYWAGPQKGDRYEVTRPADGKLMVRYLPAGERAGTKTQFLSVGSYMQPDAYKTVEKLAAKPKSNAFEVAHGGLAYVDGAAPQSVYLAFPRVPTQIEVYDPHPGRAQALVRSGVVAPIG